MRARKISSASFMFSYEEIVNQLWRNANDIETSLAIWNNGDTPKGTGQSRERKVKAMSKINNNGGNNFMGFYLLTTDENFVTFDQCEKMNDMELFKTLDETLADMETIYDEVEKLEKQLATILAAMLKRV